MEGKYQATEVPASSDTIERRSEFLLHSCTGYPLHNNEPHFVADRGPRAGRIMVLQYCPGQYKYDRINDCCRVLARRRM
jgi:hypothetical protein